MLDIPNARGATWIADSVSAVQEHAIYQGCTVRLIRRGSYGMRKLFYVNERLCELHTSRSFAEGSDRLVEFHFGNLRRRDVVARIFRTCVAGHEPVHFIVPTEVLWTLYPHNEEAACYVPIDEHLSLKFYHRLWFLFRESWNFFRSH